MATADATSLAFDRTYLAHERTLMAWIRTATSLISFGFALYKFFFYVKEFEHAPASNETLSPRGYGLILIGTGVMILAAAIAQHWLALRALRAQHQAVPMSLATIVAASICMLGVLAFIEAAYRM